MPMDYFMGVAIRTASYRRHRHRLPNAQLYRQEIELHYRTGCRMRHPFLARSFEVEDAVGIVRLNFAQRV
jgi:hypothetical protein